MAGTQGSQVHDTKFRAEVRSLFSHQAEAEDGVPIGRHNQMTIGSRQLTIYSELVNNAR
jgi:hypothetical protein